MEYILRDAVGSTNDWAREWAGRHAGQPACLRARHQTAGRGRRGAVWTDTPDESILMSLVLYTDLRNDQVWRVGIGACLSVIDTINGMFPGASRPKWPNDVVIGECKCAGVLVESGLAKGIEGGCVVGIGVNVLQPEFVDPSFPVQPISLAIAFGAEAIPSLDVMAREIANRMAARSERLSDNGAWHTSFVEWRETMLLGGQQTGMDIETGELVSGVLSDVRENDGAGVLVLADGRSRTVQPVSIQMPGRDLV